MDKAPEYIVINYLDTVAILLSFRPDWIVYSKRYFDIDEIIARMLFSSFIDEFYTRVANGEKELLYDIRLSLHTIGMKINLDHLRFQRQFRNLFPF